MNRTREQYDPGAVKRVFPPTDETGDLDVEQLEYNLSLTPDERMRQYMQWMALVESVRAGGREFYGVESGTTEAAE